jgi:ATP-dependent RNA helicase RhlE
VFVRTKATADRLTASLRTAGVRANCIHADRPQPERLRALELFTAGELRVLVATEIAARGIDVDGVSHVINYDMPNVPESYVHRVGRTARGGAVGVAITFCAEADRPMLAEIERRTRVKMVPLT